MNQCPKCRGEKQIYAFENRGDKPHTSGMRDCPCCEGIGHISDTKKKAIEDGYEMRLQRNNRGESLADCAYRLGISVAELSSIENGKIT